MDDNHWRVSTRIKYAPLRGALRAVLQTAHDGDSDSGVAMLCVAVEQVTALLGVKHGLALPDKPTLWTKNQALRDAEIIDEPTFERIRQLTEIRNKVLHANLGSVRPLQLGSVIEVLDACLWLCGLIERLDLVDYEPPESAEQATFRRFFDPA
jgi:hypothetical protein